MLTIQALAEEVAEKRKATGMTQSALAARGKVSRATIDALENGRLGELGFTKITNILAALGLELEIRQATTRRPTLEELTDEDDDDQDLDRRR